MEVGPQLHPTPGKAVLLVTDFSDSAQGDQLYTLGIP